MAKKKQLIENKIYAAIIGLCEEKEHEGAYRGNGHHFRKSMADVRYAGNDNCPALYEAQHYFVTTFLQIFWLWFVIGIEIKTERLSSSKYVNYEATHYAAVEDALNS